MIYQTAEERYRQGRQLLTEGKVREATTGFREAIELENRELSETEIASARYHSYYGLCLGLTRMDIRQAMHQCRLAVRLDRYRPDCWWNLGRVALARNRRGEAYRAFTEGLKIQPDHRGLLEDSKRMGVRKRPVLTVVSRQNPLNVVLGRMRSHLSRPVHPLMKLSQRR